MRFEIEHEFRPMHKSEEYLICKLACSRDELKSSLLDQIRHCLVRVTDRYGSLEIRVSVNDYRVSWNGLYAEALFADDDYQELTGAAIEVLLFLADGFLDELKIYKQNGAEMLSYPSESNLLELYVEKGGS